ncbi:O-methyltransferase [Desulfobulbus rhabdoformis]|uniref:O-methyltransferase n=1 Tax=Desulfobulbus rhabdoformis TaxID=34032 RepID=UPI0019659363|nr:O-methyltransferase [Desulfobulbus rhabdoformis]MBM9617013.1 O-methyltransferase [Desulfobulbus rhabdoformis]
MHGASRQFCVNSDRLKGEEMDLDNILSELEQDGIRNDKVQSDRTLKYLNITKDTGEFLRVLALATCSSKILEIGTSNGYSTLWLASSIPPDGTVTTIEYSDQKAKEALSNFERAGLVNKIALLQGDAQAVLKNFSGQYDFIFLDADRSKYMDMIEDISRLLKNGGLIVCDNASSHESELAEFMNYLKSQKNFITSLVPVGKGEFLAYKS